MLARGGALCVEELAPTGRRERDDAGPVGRGQIREDFAFRAGVFGVVADVEDVVRRVAGELGDNRPVVGGESDVADAVPLFEMLADREDPPRDGVSPKAEQEDIAVFGVEIPECAFEAAGDEGGDAGVGLDDEVVAIAPGGESIVTMPRSAGLMEYLWRPK